MATITLDSNRVRNACNDGLAWIKNYRNELLSEAIKEEMSRTRFSFREFGKVPCHLSEAEALEAIKKDTTDFFWFATRYDYIMAAGQKTEESLIVLKGMAGKAPTIDLTTKDYEVVKGYL